MELWIRSQNKENLSMAKNIKLDKYIGDKENTIITNDYFEVGKYKSKERALEVLDEIQKTLKPQLIIKDSGKIIGSFEDTIIREGTTYELKELSTYVYEMPEE